MIRNPWQPVAPRVPVVHDYFSVIYDIQLIRDAVMKTGQKYGATKFSGTFDLHKVSMAYLEDPEMREKINQVVGVGRRGA